MDLDARNTHFSPGFGRFAYRKALQPGMDARRATEGPAGA